MRTTNCLTATGRLLPQFKNAELASSEGRAALEGGAADVLQLTGISGTSGGAISALLAWYGYLLGGAEAARTRLERFWVANCATRPGERLLNDVGQWVGSMAQVDLKLSPYLCPLREISLVRMKGSTLLRRVEDGWQLAETRLLNVEQRRAPDAAEEAGAGVAADERPPARRHPGQHKGDGGMSLH
ncbi:hypothetical protein [Telluria beijingensis]|uniref:hypothetical protein n=1 Tax=Telluria beijingensis TaxID=3068633 RepID=UPI0027954232|nr:hypothetical protein [Massilia sp. REN29]